MNFSSFPFLLAPLHLRKDMGYLTGCNDYFRNKGARENFEAISQQP